MDTEEISKAQAVDQYGQQFSFICICAQTPKNTFFGKIAYLHLLCYHIYAKMPKNRYFGKIAHKR